MTGGHEVRPGPGWALPTFPHDPVEGPPELTEVPGAILTRVRRGDLRTIVEPTRWIRGAVHDAEGRLVVSSQKIGGLVGAQVAQADPARVPPRQQAGARRLEGTWLYGGHWTQHFGHFFAETLTTLWPEGPQVAGVSGIVFHNFMSRLRGVSDWQTELLDLAGWGGVPFEVIEDENLVAERLLVPGRGIVVNGWAWEQARTVWRRMAAAAGGRLDLDPDGDRVFVTRTAFNRARRAEGRPTRTDEAHDLALDSAFAGAGFRVVAPESLGVAEQLRLAAGASVLAGCAGSALHLSAFAPAGARVVELGDSRSPDVQVPTQRVIDRVCEHPSAFVPYDVPTAALPGVLADLGL
ncbi:glycosyltransferase family 61 protein [Nocardioides rubriscoriae]|uniref:glycosyltransferase family 61 protein n=1 Tax=Nocardioides rubriscoriae TaxID=642762 RepID=UPI001478C205|nr:glycosyltransferase 61 family protein [Nocardioides rubriscoriae]